MALNVDLFLFHFWTSISVEKLHALLARSQVVRNLHPMLIDGLKEIVSSQAGRWKNRHGGLRVYSYTR